MHAVREIGCLQNGHGALQAPEQYGLKSSKLPPSLVAAMLRASLALSTAAEGMRLESISRCCC